MIYRVLGLTEVKVSAIGLGGWHLGLPRVSEQTSIRIVRSALDRGINFLDDCWDYNEGASEIRMGKALRNGYREKSFLMTKIDGRSKQEGTKQLDESLKRLDVDCIDLVQHHEIILLGLANDHAEATYSPSGHDLTNTIDAAFALLQAVYPHIEDRFQFVAPALELDALAQETLGGLWRNPA